MTSPQAPHIRLEADSSTGVISVTPEGVADGAWADISQLLSSNGGHSARRGIDIPNLGLRRAAEDLGALLRHYSISAIYDAAARRLLELHLAEVHDRKLAEQDYSRLDDQDVEKLVRKTGRFTRSLTPQQVQNLGRLLKLRHGANFSVPGAGKTATLLAVYEAGRGGGRVDRLLVVAPKNAFLAWEEEVAKSYNATANLQVARIVGGRDAALEILSHDPEIALITYQFLPNVLDLVSAWCRRHRMQVVLDESHRIKSGATGVYSRAALDLSEAACRRDVLSGTPLPNAPEDLRSQVDFLWPGQRLFPEARVSAESDARLLEQVQRCVQPFYVRTTKGALQLPELRVRPVVVEPGPRQRELYDLLRTEAKRFAAGMTAKDRQFLRRLGGHVIRLIEAASNPLLLARSDNVELGEDSGRSQAWEILREFASSEMPAKVRKALEITEECLRDSPTNKVLIWTSFVPNVHLMEKLLSSYGPVTLFGAIPTGSEEDSATREGRIRRFHGDQACRVMIANPAACGEGISLHQACHHAVYLDRTFNAAHYLQSIDRIHRLGLPPGQVTRVDILECRGTIDSRVARRLKAKIDSMSRILNDEGLAELAYDPEDVVEEFPAGIEAEDVEEIVDHVVGRDERE